MVFARTRPAALLAGVLLLGAAPLIRAEPAPDEIHWTILDAGSVAITWRGGGDTVTFWPEGRPSPAVTATGAPATGPHRTAVLARLTPDTRYRYRLAGEPAGGGHLFHTPPATCADGFTFAAEGDIGAPARSPDAPAVQRLIAEAHPAFVLGLGDLAYANGSDALVNGHFDDVMVWSTDAAYMPAWGNHDWMYGHGDDLAMYKDRFALPHAQASPGAPAAGSGDKDWSWFDYGCLRVITYPEPYTAATWDDWAVRAEPIFAAAEADPRVRFVVTAGHRPAVTSGGHHGEARLRKILEPLASKYRKYVMNLAGHNHDYERTAREHGLVHLTVGTGGARLDRQPTPCGWADCQPPAWSRFRALHHGVAILSVSADRISGRFVCGPPSPRDDVTCAEGTVLDTFEIRR